MNGSIQIQALNHQLFREQTPSDWCRLDIDSTWKCIDIGSRVFAIWISSFEMYLTVLDIFSSRWTLFHHCFVVSIDRPNVVIIFALNRHTGECWHRVSQNNSCAGGKRGLDQVDCFNRKEHAFMVKIKIVYFEWISAVLFRWFWGITLN